jgi:hypothetical protein
MKVNPQLQLMEPSIQKRIFCVEKHVSMLTLKIMKIM